MLIIDYTEHSFPMNHISVMLTNVWLRKIKISLWQFHNHTFQKWLLHWFLDCWSARVGLHTCVSQQKSSVNTFVCVDCCWEFHMQRLIWWPSAQEEQISVFKWVGVFQRPQTLTGNWCLKRERDHLILRNLPEHKHVFMKILARWTLLTNPWPLR